MMYMLPSRVLPDVIRHLNRVHLVETLRATSPKIPSGKSLRRSTSTYDNHFPLQWRCKRVANWRNIFRQLGKYFS